MMIALLIIVSVLCWWGIGIASVAYCIYTDELAFTDTFYGSREPFLDRSAAFGVSLVGPLFVLWVLADRTFRATWRARVKNTKLREELEKELADARRQVDELLRKETPTHA